MRPVESNRAECRSLKTPAAALLIGIDWIGGIHTDMMALTHGFMSLALATLVLPVVSDHVAPPLVLAAAVVGGLLPDLDVLASHRRTLHYPVIFPILTLGALAAFFSTGTPGLLLLGVLLGAAGLHSLSDILGGSAERAPWNPVTEFGVYNHVLGRWHRPRRFVRYSGAPEDFMIGGGFALVALLSPGTAPVVDLLLVGLVGIAGGYTLARKRLESIATSVDAVIPLWLRAIVPSFEVEEHEGGGTTVVIRLGR